MVKIRLKRLGYKKNPVYRIVVLNSTTKRQAAPIQQLGFYNPKTKEMQLDKAAALDWVSKGAQPTETVKYLLDNCNEDGTLNYKKKTTEKLSKKAQAKLEAEKAAAEEAAKAAAEAAASARSASHHPGGRRRHGRFWKAPSHPHRCGRSWHLWQTLPGCR